MSERRGRRPLLTSVPERGIVQCALVWLALLLVSTGMAVLFGVSLLAASAYAAYVALFIILPGVVHYGLASRSAQLPFVFAAKAVVVGQCVEMSAGLLASMAGGMALYPFLPLLYLAELVFWRRRILANIEAGEEPGILPAVVSLVVALFLVLAGSLVAFQESIDQHFTWIAAFSNVAVTQWPIHEPFLMDVPLHYHYLFNIHVGTAARTFGIPLILVASRLAIIFHVFLFVLMLHAFCRSRFRAGWLGTPAAVQLLLTFGSSAVLWPYFHLATAPIIFQLTSTAVAFGIFLVLCDEILGPAGHESQRPYALIVFLMLVASGTRANLLPMLCGGIGLVLIAHVRQGYQRAAYVGLLGAAMLAIIAGAVFFLGMGGGGSNGTSLLLIRPLNVAVSEVAKDVYSPIVRTLLAAGLPRELTAMAYLLVAILGRMTFLLPGLIFALVGTGSGIERNLRVMVGGVALAGIGLLVLIEAVVPQEIWAFYWFADIGFALLGAAGLRALWQRRVTRPVLAGAALLASTLLFVLQLWDSYPRFSQALSVTRLPTPAPVFQTLPGFKELVQTLEQHVVPGDVLVTGGNFWTFDDRVLPAAVPGLQLYASRLVLPIYEARVNVDPRVASRLWLIRDNLRDSVARATILTDVGPSRGLYFLWFGETVPADRTGLSPVGRWPLMSLWRIEFHQDPLSTNVFPNGVQADQARLIRQFPCSLERAGAELWYDSVSQATRNSADLDALQELLSAEQRGPLPCLLAYRTVAERLAAAENGDPFVPSTTTCDAELALAEVYVSRVFDDPLRQATRPALEMARTAQQGRQIELCRVAVGEIRQAYFDAIFGVNDVPAVASRRRLAAVGIDFEPTPPRIRLASRFPCSLEVAAAGRWWDGGRNWTSADGKALEDLFRGAQQGTIACLSAYKRLTQRLGAAEQRSAYLPATATCESELPIAEVYVSEVFDDVLRQKTIPTLDAARVAQPQGRIDECRQAVGEIRRAYFDAIYGSN